MMQFLHVTLPRVPHAVHGGKGNAHGEEGHGEGHDIDADVDVDPVGGDEIAEEGGGDGGGDEDGEDGEAYGAVGYPCGTMGGGIVGCSYS